MSEDTEGDGTGNRSGATTPRRPEAGFEAVRPGDRVVYTTDLGKEYAYTVATVDPPWLTFETGQQVHRARFDREDFAVVRTVGTDPTGVETGGTGDARETDAQAGEAPTPATDGGDLRPPNAD